MTVHHHLALSIVLVLFITRVGRDPYRAEFPTKCNLHRAPVLGHSIIINGECASGKTETARVLLRHLLHHSSAGAVPGHEREHAMSLTEKIVQANVLLEALGSARLCRNYNSRYCAPTSCV